MALLALVLLFLDLSVFSTGSDVTCGFPGTPAYGYVKPDAAAYEEGDVVFYSCRVGYILLGSPISRCTDDGSWTEDVPICDDSMTTLGVAFSTPTVPGHPAESAIDRDKETCTYLKPKKPRWWRIDLGEEHKVLSVAVTMISQDKFVKFTVFVIKTQGTSASYKRCAFFSGKFGTQTVVLACAEGKGIEGQKVHIEDHNQTGLFELCEFEVQVEKDTGYDCGRPSRNPYSLTFEPEGNQVEYACITGYEVTGNDIRTCLNSGQWAGEPPKCEPIICDDLEVLVNGKTSLSIGKRTTPLEGAIAIYQCDEGYKILGNRTRNCLKDGSWNGKPPICKAIRCPTPDGKVVGGVYRMIDRSNAMGSTAELKCKRGIKREGDNPFITCTEDGEWTKPEAHCIWPAGTSSEIKEDPIIVNKGAIIFGMVVAGVMIVVVLVSLYLYTQKRRNYNTPEVPSRLLEPQAPPPRPPPRSKGDGFKTAFRKIARENASAENAKDSNAWKTQSLPSDHAHCNDIDGQDMSSPIRTLSYNETLPNKANDDNPAVIEVEVLAQDVPRQKGIYSSVPEENENTSLENVVLDIKESGRKKGASSPTQPADYAEVDYDKKRQSRRLKEQDSMESSSTAGPSPLPLDDAEEPESRSPTPPKHLSRSETEESEVSSPSAPVSEPRTRGAERRRKEELRKKEEEQKRKEEEEEQKRKEEEEQKRKEEEEQKRKEEEEQKRQEEEQKKKEEEEKKEKEKQDAAKADAPTGAASRRRRVREDPPPVVDEKPVLRRVRRL